MTTAAMGQGIHARARIGRRRGVVLAVLVLVGAALAVHLAMPSWYAKLWYPLEHTGAITVQARANGLEPELVAAVIYRESHFTESARSDRGAVGLMQLLPETAAWIHRQPGSPDAPPERLGDPVVNIAYGAWYLHYLMDKYGDEGAALAAYNGGENNVQKWLGDARRAGRGTLAMSDIRFPETRSFVRAVLDARGVYRDAWGSSLSG